MPWARASGLERHMACQATSWLPRWNRGKWDEAYVGAHVYERHVLTPQADRDTTAADWGTASHAAKANLPTASDPWLSMWEPHRDRLYPPSLGKHEVAVSYDCFTRAIEVYPGCPGDEMDAWKEARGCDCVVGTMDWLGALPAGEPWIDDLKTGWRTPEVITAQTKFYALVAARLAKADSCRLSITHWPKAADEPTREGLWRQLTLLHLDDFEDELNAAWKRTMASRNARPGPHCKYCPSMGACTRVND